MSLSRRSFLKQCTEACTSMFLPSIFILSASSLFAETTHTVKKGETLSKIAKKYDVSIADIKTKNKLKSDKITVGQKLVIPTKQQPAIQTPQKTNPNNTVIRPVIEPENSSLDDVIRFTKKLSIPNGRWKYIVVHHSAIERGNAKIYDKNHRSRGMENGLAYHFVIGNGIDSGEGQIEIGPRWEKQLAGGHVKSQAVNEIGIGICLVGNFEERKPSQKQLASLYSLISYLTKVVNGRYVMKVHKEVDGSTHTLCPGKNFPIRELHKKFPDTISV